MKIHAKLLAVMFVWSVGVRAEQSVWTPVKTSTDIEGKETRTFGGAVTIGAKGPEKVLLVVRCIQGEAPEFMLSYYRTEGWNSVLLDTRVRYRFDDGPIQTETWGWDEAQVYAPRRVALKNGLLNAQTFTVELRPSGYGPVVAHFALKGFSEQFHKSCPVGK